MRLIFQSDHSKVSMASDVTAFLFKISGRKQKRSTADLYGRSKAIIAHQMLTADDFIVSKTQAISDVSMSERLNMSAALSAV